MLGQAQGPGQFRQRHPDFGVSEKCKISLKINMTDGEAAAQILCCKMLHGSHNLIAEKFQLTILVSS